MGRVFDIVKWGATRGGGSQVFLGAGWIRAFLNKVPESKKRTWALRILSMSPHYFIDGGNPAFREMSTDEYLETSFQIISKTREEIYEKILKEHLSQDLTVLDYGCGPGFLAKATAPYVKKIYALDISPGAIACANIVNAADNIEYLVADDKGLAAIPDNSLDAVYSFAVIQHLTDEVFEIVLDNCRRKLKPNGLLLLHIQLTDDIWQTEDNWKNDKSIKGQVKLKYGLHCFGRTEQQHLELLSKHGFVDVKIEKIAHLFRNESEDLGSQRFLIARKRSD